MALSIEQQQQVEAILQWSINPEDIPRRISEGYYTNQKFAMLLTPDTAEDVREFLQQKQEARLARLAAMELDELFEVIKDQSYQSGMDSASDSYGSLRVSPSISSDDAESEIARRIEAAKS